MRPNDGGSFHRVGDRFHVKGADMTAREIEKRLLLLVDRFIKEGNPKDQAEYQRLYGEWRKLKAQQEMKT